MRGSAALWWALLAVLLALAEPARLPLTVSSLKLSSLKPSSDQLGNNPVVKGVKKNLNILKNGVVGMAKNLKEARKLRKTVSSQGEEALSFTEFKLLEQVKHDLQKSARILLMLPMAPQYFFYSYIVGPMMSNSPWAWASLPSTFDDAHNAAARERALSKRRLQAILSSLNILKTDTHDDKDKTLREKRENQLTVIEDTLRQPDMVAALTRLNDFILRPSSRKGSSSTALSSQQFPPSIVRECIKCFGVDGVPSWLPLVRRLNNGELKKYFERLERSDSFLLGKRESLKDLSPRELERACLERGIALQRSAAEMQADLKQWLHLISAPTTQSASPLRSVGVQENLQNKRFAMMALNIAKDFKTSPFTSTFRSVVDK